MSDTVTLERPMGRKRSENPRDDVSVKVDRSVVEKARFVALARDTTLAALLTEMLSGQVEKAYSDEAEKRFREPKR